MRRKWIVLLCMAAFLIIQGSAVAQEEAEKGPIPEVGTVFSLGEIVVTGAEDAVEKIATTDVIDEEQMDLTTSRNVAEALDTLPGVFLNVGTRNELFGPGV
ncbi:MAG: hypothetical protein JRL30_15845 [Deltaproteobacteria bacterium]|nr:hypothetical protein [Deltaproteobacteria bacterium]